MGDEKIMLLKRPCHRVRVANPSLSLSRYCIVVVVRRSSSRSCWSFVVAIPRKSWFVLFDCPQAAAQIFILFLMLCVFYFILLFALSLHLLFFHFALQREVKYIYNVVQYNIY